MQLNYQRSGQGEPLILVHGLFGSLENLGMIKRHMQAFFDVISVDLPDHGQSFYTQQFSYQEYAQSILSLMDTLDLAKANILGHSLGGKIAMYLALNHPNRVNKLVVADIAPVAYSPRHQAVLAGLNAVNLNQITDRKQAERQMSEFIQEPGVRQFLLKSLSKSDNGWKWAFNLALLQRDYGLLSQAISSDKAFTGSTLFVKGANSDYLLAEHQPIIQALFPHSKARVIANTGHWLHAEKPAAFNQAVAQFLSK